jgi:hypothetical protein
MQQYISLNEIYVDAKTYGDWGEEMGYGYSTVSFEVNLSTNNSHYQILPLYKTRSVKDKEIKTLGISIRTPDLSRNNCSPLLVDDTWEYVIGIGKNGKSYHDAYLNLLNEAYAYSPTKELATVINWATNLSENIESEILSLAPSLKTVKQRSGAKVIFNVDGNRVTAMPEYVKFWQSHYLRKQDITGGSCGITGEYQDIVAGIMPTKIKGVPATQAAGAALFSFNETAYEAYNRKGAMNSPMGFEPLLTIHLFFNFLLREKHYHHRLKDKVILFWGEQGITLNQDAWFGNGLPNTQDTIHALFSFPKTSNPVFIEEDDTKSQSIRFLTLIGNAGRIAIEASLSISTAELIKNYLRFQSCQFKDSKAIAPWQVMKACYRKNSTAKEEFADLNLRFIHALLFGKPLPNMYISKVLHLICYGEGLTLSRLVALRFYLALKQDKNMIKHSEEMINYARALGKMYWTIGQAQAISQDRDHEQTNASSNLWALSQNNRTIANRLHSDAISLYFKRSNTSEKKLGLLSKCRKLFDKYAIETSANYLEKFDSDLQSYFLVGWHEAQEEYMTKSEKKEKGEEE